MSHNFTKQLLFLWLSTIINNQT